MGLLSASNSITRYTVAGQLKRPVLETVAAGLKKNVPVLETVAAGLKKNVISEIDDHASEKAVGWTSFEKPYQPDVSGSTYAYGTYLVFALRIDKKNIPSKVVKKYFMIESAQRLFLRCESIKKTYHPKWSKNIL
jgi:hypothetical protein